jgi:aminomethyltransferase
MTNTLAKTPLAAWHEARGARMVDFAGWSMPVQYTSIVEEHLATRQAVTLFDVSHMGRFQFEGPGADLLLEGLLTRRVVDMAVGGIRYSLVTNETGGVRDDVLCYRLNDVEGQPQFGLVVNASNRAKIAHWIDTHITGDSDVIFTDRTESTAMIAVQGPQALSTVQPLTEMKLDEMKYFTGAKSTVAGRTCFVSRTGYTGEDGVELIMKADDALAVWKSVFAAGESFDVKPAGLGCRDTLRLESAMPLYGHELSEEIDPLTAGLKFAVNLENRTFPGRDAIAAIAERGPTEKRVGLQLDGRRVPREEYPVVVEGKTIGRVTSGTFSPTFERPIAMAYIQQEYANIGGEVSVDIRGRLAPAKIVKLPFYQRTVL